MSHSHGQSSFKTLFHNYGKCHKTHSMTTRQEDQDAMYDDAKDTSTPHNTTTLPANTIL